jgi:hypothetical protein
MASSIISTARKRKRNPSARAKTAAETPILSRAKPVVWEIPMEDAIFEGLLIEYNNGNRARGGWKPQGWPPVIYKVQEAYKGDQVIK